MHIIIACCSVQFLNSLIFSLSPLNNIESLHVSYGFVLIIVALEPSFKLIFFLCLNPPDPVLGVWHFSFISILGCKTFLLSFNIYIF